MKKLFSFALALMLAASSIPAAVFAAPTAIEPKYVSDGNVVIDTDGSDGYSGDYVVIYNPNTGSGTLNTGNMSGLIETTVSASAQPSSSRDRFFADGNYIIDVDPALALEAQRAGITREHIKAREGAASLSFEVGDRRNFTISSYSPLGSSVEFEVLAKGEHCYIWTPTSTAPNVWPLDEIDPTFADIAAAEFDTKFELMQASFGNHENGSQGDGRLNMLYYNIDDGWQPGQGSIGGYFTSMDFFTNGMPCLNIDTYPGVHYESVDGEVIEDISRTFNVMVHEYQHLINFSECGFTDTWINECMSAAAEELCYPASSISRRIQSWTNYFFDNGDWNNPPSEFQYVPNFSLHNGYSMYEWDNDMDMDDILVLYAQVSLFAQYIYTQHGNTFFRSLMQQLAQGRSFVNAYQNITSQNTADFVGNFRVALTANTSPDVLGGVYGFRMQDGYDSSMYHGVENLYNWLGPVVFTGSQCAISSGGAITVKPVGGVYNPPSGASNGLRYFGVTRSSSAPTPIPVTGVSIQPESETVPAGGTISLTAALTPGNANSYTITWSSSNSAVASVSGSGLTSTVTGVAAGSAAITVDVLDQTSGSHFTATAAITVTENDGIMGDVDMDGSVTVADALLAMRGAMQLITLTPQQLALADVDGNAGLTVSDAIIIIRIAMGLMS